MGSGFMLVKKKSVVDMQFMPSCITNKVGTVSVSDVVSVRADK